MKLKSLDLTIASAIVVGVAALISIKLAIGLWLATLTAWVYLHGIRVSRIRQTFEDIEKRDLDFKDEYDKFVAEMRSKHIHEREWLRDNPEAMASVQRGLAQAKAGQFVDDPSLLDDVEDIKEEEKLQELKEASKVVSNIESPKKGSKHSKKAKIKYDHIKDPKRRKLIEDIHKQAEAGTLAMSSNELIEVDTGLKRDYSDEKIPLLKSKTKTTTSKKKTKKPNKKKT